MNTQESEMGKLHVVTERTPDRAVLEGLKHAVDTVTASRDERLAECKASAREVLRLYVEGFDVSDELAARVITRLLLEVCRND